eukprot:7275193-Pyramimonas_sp.AAC.1
MEDQGRCKIDRCSRASRSPKSREGLTWHPNVPQSTQIADRPRRTTRRHGRWGPGGEQTQ